MKYDPDATLRVAGGWLLGRHGGDIDIAVDTCTGKEFVDHIARYQRENGSGLKRIGLVKANPSKSKHLETAMAMIHDHPVDFVALRTDQYTEGSRIPTITKASLKEDALRRDFTVNALYYNLTENVVEDPVALGLSDLQQRVIRTCMFDAKATLLDDPLRVLRAVRFAAELKFSVDAALLQAASSVEVQDALMKKVSRERVGIELRKMLMGSDPTRAVDLIGALSLFDCVFNIAAPPRPVPALYARQELKWSEEEIEWAETAVAQCCTESTSATIPRKPSWNFLLAAALSPLHRPLASEAAALKASSEREELSYSQSYAYRIARTSLKLSNNESEYVHRVLVSATEAIALMHSINLSNLPQSVHDARRLFGLWVRRSDGAWKDAVVLACIYRSYMLGLPHLPPRDLIQAVENAGLHGAVSLRPIVNGKELQEELNMGPSSAVSDLLESLVGYQIENPDATKQEALKWLRSQTPTHL